MPSPATTHMPVPFTRLTIAELKVLLGLPTAVGTAAGRDTSAVNPAKAYGGYKAWSYDLASAGSTKMLTAAVEIFIRVPVIEAETISTVVYEVTTLAATNTHGYITAYTSAGVFIAQSADQSTIWQTTGKKSLALAVGAVTAGDFVFLSFYTGTAGTLPVFRAGSASAALNDGFSAGTGWRCGTLARADVAGWTDAVDPGSMAASSGLIGVGLL